MDGDWTPTDYLDPTSKRSYFALYEEGKEVPPEYAEVIRAYETDALGKSAAKSAAIPDAVFASALRRLSRAARPLDDRPRIYRIDFDPFDMVTMVQYSIIVQLTRNTFADTFSFTVTRLYHRGIGDYLAFTCAPVAGISTRARCLLFALLTGGEDLDQFEGYRPEVSIRELTPEALAETLAGSKA